MRGHVALHGNRIALERWVAGFAIAVWGGGLLAAALAVHYAQDQQRAISQGHRLMRQEVERVFFGEAVTDITGPRTLDEEAWSRLPLRMGCQGRNRDRKKRRLAKVDERTHLREEAQRAGELMRDWRTLSLLAFGGGAAVALAAVFS